MKVAKFGGTSLASAEQFRKVGSIVASDPQRRIIVVSAPGKRHKADTKVTDMLIACAEHHLAFGEADQEVRAVAERYGEIARDLGLGDAITKTVADDLRTRLAGDKRHRGRYIDTLKAAGEDNCAKLFAEFLCSLGVQASYVSPREAGLLVSDEAGNARVLPESYANLRRLRERPGVTVFPGFFGHSPKGDVVTFPRGGSDITGSVVAAGVKAELYENFTDVDSVFVASPSIIEKPCAIAEITYREMRELSYAGFSVFHEEALEPAYHAGVPVRCWLTRECGRDDCPAYGSGLFPCWLYDGTLCHGDGPDAFPAKLDHCYGCSVYQANAGVGDAERCCGRREITLSRPARRALGRHVVECLDDAEEAAVGVHDGRGEADEGAAGGARERELAAAAALRGVAHGGVGLVDGALAAAVELLGEDVGPVAVAERAVVEPAGEEAGAVGRAVVAPALAGEPAG